MIETVLIAGLEGLARALGQRLGKGKGDSVEIKALARDVRELSSLQNQANITVAELTTRFQQLVMESDGLRLSHRVLHSRARVRFEPTAQSPTLGDALLHLDQNIQRLRDGSSAPVPAGRPDGERSGSSPEEIGIFEGLDEEIQQRRTSGGSGRAAG